jgi:hypothetical protein
VKPRHGKTDPRAEEAIALLREVEGLLAGLRVGVSYDRALDGKGGLCVVRGERRIILNQRLPPAERAELLLEGLERLDLPEESVPAELRSRIRAAGGGAGSARGATSSSSRKGR